MKKLLRFGALMLALLPVWAPSSQAQVKYLKCETVCCMGYGTEETPCNDYGFVTTCGEWWVRKVCP